MSEQKAYIKFAANAHGNQKYGEHDYVHHLFCVAEVLREFGYTDDMWQAAAWLHDVIEDTTIGYEAVLTTFGADVATLVYCCTGIGKNRSERLENIIDKIKVYQSAAVVKVADRIANCEAGGKLEMYRKEHDMFSALKKYVPTAMWERYEKALNGN